MSAVRFTAVGHLTNDTLPQGIFPGGSALYAGLSAQALGADVTVITSLGPDFVGHPGLQGPRLTVRDTPAPRTTHFEERYELGRRWARVHAVARRLPAEPHDADILFVCPVMDEVERTGWQRREGQLLAAGLQGWLRAVGDGGQIGALPLDELGFLRPFQVVFVSDEDLGPHLAPTVERLRTTVETVVVTEGGDGATIHHGGRSIHVPALAVDVVDPTGAGDTFAACFLWALAHGQDLGAAGELGAAGAAAIISGVGTSNVDVLSHLGHRATGPCLQHATGP